MTLSNYKSIYSAFSSAMSNLGSLFWDRLRPALDETGIEAPRGTFSLFTALALDPDPISSAYIQMRLPYGAEGPWANLLSTFEREQGYLHAADGGYRLTEDGHNAAATIRQALYKALASLHTLDDEDLIQFISILRKIADAQAQATDPPGAAFIRVTRNLRNEEAPLLGQLDQLSDELAAFRDECHIAAWQPLGVSGVTWDAFNNVWSGQVSSAKDLQEMLPFLGHSEAIFEKALQTAKTKAWLSSDNDTYHVTDDGNAIREKVETQTDTYFYTPWDCLTTVETQALNDVATRFQAKIEAMTADSG